MVGQAPPPVPAGALARWTVPFALRSTSNSSKDRRTTKTMKATRLLSFCAALLLLVTGTGCFRVSSDTHALRDAALDSGFARAEEKIEFGVGFFTVGLAKLATHYIDIPAEARTALSSLKQAECAVYEVQQRRESLASILMEADKAMESRGCERLVGVIQARQLVAIYVPRDMNSAHDVKASVLVLDGNHLVCVTARANARDLMQLALDKLRVESSNSSAL
jgi:hypothetical protein